MSANTTIAWTDKTWNPVRGCSLVSPGCTNCYAMRQARRFSGPGQPYEGLTRMTEHGPLWTGKVRLVESELDAPLRWRKPCRVFVNSMSDLFHEDVPFEFITQVWNTMYRASEHTFQVLTKRPERMLAFHRMFGEANKMPLVHNVWLGVSVENQATADERIPILLQTPAAVRFLSAEPLLEPIDLATWFFSAMTDQGKCACDWVIVGGESGPGARPCNVEWIRSIVRQCRGAHVPVFVKQLGSQPVWHEEEGTYCDPPSCIRHTKKLRDHKGGDPSEWPEYLRVREFPR